MNNTSKPLRVLHVVTSMNFGGLETMIMNYYRHIDRQKVQFDFLVHREERASYDDEIELLGGIIYRLPRLVPWSIRYRKALNDFFQLHPEYKIVHVHQDCLGSIALKAAKKHGVPIRIAHSHNSDIDKNIKYPIKIFYKQFITKYATKLMACGELAGKWMFGCSNASKFSVLPNAIDSKVFDYNPQERKTLRKELGISDEEFVIGHVGRFSPQKNHLFVVDVFKAMHELKQNSKLILVGDGKLRSIIEKRVLDLGLKECVYFAGTTQMVSSYFQAMDAFVLPSKYEGLAIVVIEAQTAGLPCIIADSISDECVIDLELVSKLSIEDTPQNWAKCILDSLDILRKGRRANTVMSGYDIIECAKKLQTFYLECLDE